MAMICSVGMFAETVTISEDCFKNLPEETQKYVRENAVVSDDNDDFQHRNRNLEQLSMRHSKQSVIIQ